MKRSEINNYMKEAEKFFREMNFNLPRWSEWTVEQWKEQKSKCSGIFTNSLGWDLTDFGSGVYEKTGLLLFTLRNGRAGVDKKTYAEKIMMVKENQETPFHFHWLKMEDIINRGGGNLLIDLYKADEREEFSRESFEVEIDGVIMSVEAGHTVKLIPGQSICLQPYVYHRFYGETGAGPVLVGEVSMVNDDTADNRFKTAPGRFPSIEEDELPYHLLVTDYQAFV